MLSIQGLHFRYEKEEKTIFHELSFDVEEGDFLSIVGPSGSGKTTLLRLLNGLEKPQSGKILLRGHDLAKASLPHAAYMPQKDLLLPWRSTLENVLLPSQFQPQKSKPTEDGEAPLEKAQRLLHRVGLGDWMDKRPGQLSGGMRQRAAFARTLMVEAPLLLLDEPFSALDYLTRTALQDWMMSYYLQFRPTTLLVTHDVDEAVKLSTHILLLPTREGGSTEKMKIDLPYPRTAALLASTTALAYRENILQHLLGRPL